MYLPKSPLELSIQLTTHCNISCLHCIAEASVNGNSTSIPHDRMQLLIDEAQFIGVSTLDLSGGEPLLYDGFFDICEYVLSKKFNVSFVTNGLLIPKGMKSLSRILKKYGNQLGIGVSLDGPSPESHGYFRPEDTFDPAIEAIIMLREAGANVSVSCVLNKINIRLIPEFLTFLSSIGISDIGFFPFMPLGRGEQFENEVLSSKAIHTFLKKKDSWNKVYKGNIGFKMPWEFLFLEYEKKYAGPCEAGYTRLWVNSRGEVTPCASMIDVIIGNINHDSISKIWHNSPVLKNLRDPFLLKGTCSSCQYRNGCRGGCRGLAYLMEGDYLCSDPYCPIVVQNKKVQA
jgi:radical SAM protein with 4Fe4S-binding SPASM domain